MTPPPATAAPRKPTTWLGCGCASAVAVAMAVVAGASFATWRADRRFQDMRSDPEARSAAVAAVLPHDRLPPGYHPLGALTMPFGLLSVAILADAVPGGDRDHVERAFFYAEMPDWFGREQAMREVLRGSADLEAGGITQIEVEFEPREELGRGEFEAGEANVVYLARRGTLRIDEARFGLAEEGTPKHEMAGIATMMLFDCEGDGRLRPGLWFAPDPAPGRPAVEIDLAGTPADPEALGAFLALFRPCS